MVKQSLLFQGTVGRAVLAGAAVDLEATLLPGRLPPLSNPGGCTYADTDLKASSL